MDRDCFWEQPVQYLLPYLIHFIGGGAQRLHSPACAPARPLLLLITAAAAAAAGAAAAGAAAAGHRCCWPLLLPLLAAAAELLLLRLRLVCTWF